jgi:hypothetical protein
MDRLTTADERSAALRGETGVGIADMGGGQELTPVQVRTDALPHRSPATLLPDPFDARFRHPR